MHHAAEPPSIPPVQPVPARLPRRLAAVFYDSLLLASVLFGASALALALTAVWWGSEAVTLHNPLIGNPFFSTYLFLICFFFYGGFWVYGGQTLGMRAWRLRVQRRNGGGQGIGWQQALLRFLIGGLWVAPAAYLHRVLGVNLGLSLAAGSGCLLLLLALRLPDRASESEIVVTPKS